MVAQGMFATGLLNSYCTIEDVIALISAYDLDSWGGQEAVESRISQLLIPTKQAVDTEAGRDFLRHYDQVIALDGSGTKVLSLTGQGVFPPVEVTAVKVNDEDIDSGQWRYYASANSIKLIPTARLQSFPGGVQNIQVSLEWGYEYPPGDIAMSQAKLAAAQLISELSAESQSVQQLKLGDYTVRYSPEGRYGADIQHLVTSAREAIRKYRAMRMVSI